MSSFFMFFFFSSRRRHTRYWRDWSSDVCSSDLVLQRSYPTDYEHRQGEQTGSDRPEDSDRRGGVIARRLTIRGEVGHHQRTGVGGGDVEQQPGESGDRSDERKCGILLEQGIEALLGLVHRGLTELLVPASHKVNSAIAEDRDPHEDIQERDDERPGGKLPDRATPGDPGQKQPDEGGPGYPPCPEEQRPGVQPARGPVERERLHGESREVSHEVADIEHERVQQEDGLAGDQDKAGQPNREQRSEEHTSELQSRQYLVCRLLL